MYTLVRLPAALYNALEEYYNCSLDQIRFFVRDGGVRDDPPAFAGNGCVVLKREAYLPESFGGVALIAHEVCHLCQQHRGDGESEELQEAEACEEALSFALWYVSGDKTFLLGKRRDRREILASAGGTVQCWGLGGLFSLKQILADKLYRKDRIAYIYEGPHEYLTRRGAEKVGMATEGGTMYNSLILGTMMNDMYMLPKLCQSLINKINEINKDKGRNIENEIKRAITDADRRGDTLTKEVLNNTSIKSLKPEAIRIYDRTIAAIDKGGGGQGLISFAVELMLETLYFMVWASYFEEIKNGIEEKIKSNIPFYNEIREKINDAKAELCQYLLRMVEEKEKSAFEEFVIIMTFGEGVDWIKKKLLEQIERARKFIEEEEIEYLRDKEADFVSVLKGSGAEIDFSGILTAIRSVGTAGEIVANLLEEPLNGINVRLKSCLADLRNMYNTFIFLMCSHTNEMQFLHSMDCSDGSLSINREKIIRWGRFCRDIYYNKDGLLDKTIYQYLVDLCYVSDGNSMKLNTDELLPSMLLPMCCIYTEMANCRLRVKKKRLRNEEDGRKLLLQEMLIALSNEKYRTPLAGMTFRSFFSGDKSDVDPRYTALGMAMHMIEDSFTPSHAVRAWNMSPENGIASILGFADYTKQDAFRHAHADYFVLADALMNIDYSSNQGNMTEEQENAENAKATVGAQCAIYYAAEYLSRINNEEKVKKLLEEIYTTAIYSEKVSIPPSGRCYEMGPLEKETVFIKAKDMVDRVNISDMIKAALGQVIYPGSSPLWETIDEYLEYLLKHFAVNRYPVMTTDVGYYNASQKRKKRAEKCRTMIKEYIDNLNYRKQYEQVFSRYAQPEGAISDAKNKGMDNPTVTVLLMYTYCDIPFLADILLNNAFTPGFLEQEGMEQKDKETLVGTRERYLRHLNELSLSAQDVMEQCKKTLQSKNWLDYIHCLAADVVNMVDALIDILNCRWSTNYELPKQIMSTNGKQ